MKKPIAVYVISNTMTIEILDIEHGIEDTVIYRTNEEDSCEHTATMLYGEDYRPYFMAYEIEVPLDECIRV